MGHCYGLRVVPTMCIKARVNCSVEITLTLGVYLMGSFLLLNGVCSIN